MYAVQAFMAELAGPRAARCLHACQRSELIALSLRVCGEVGCSGMRCRSSPVDARRACTLCSRPRQQWRYFMVLALWACAATLGTHPGEHGQAVQPNLRGDSSPCC